MNAEDFTFETEEYPYHQFQLISKTPEEMSGPRYWYKIKLRRAILVKNQWQNPDFLTVGPKLHEKIQSLPELKDGEWLTLQRGEDGTPDIGRAFINWEALKNMTGEEKEEMYLDLLKTFCPERYQANYAKD